MASKKMIREAALQSLVRFGPQFDALDQLTRTAKQTYGATVNAADVSSASTEHALKSARPAVTSIYDNATHGQEVIRGALGSMVGGLSGAGTDTIKAAAAAETANAATGINEAKMHALQDLTNRGLQADAARAQGVLAAGVRLHSDLADIGASRRSLANQAGAFKSATLGDLQTQADQRSFTARQNAASRRNARDIATGHDQTSRDNTTARVQQQQRNAAAKKNKGKWQTPAAHGRVADIINGAIAEATPYKDQGRSKVEQLLLVGAPAETKKNADGSTSHLAAIPKVPQLALSVALDLLYDGHVSRSNRAKLNKRGLTVKGLGFPGPPSPRAQHRLDQAHALGGVVGQLAHALGL